MMHNFSGTSMWTASSPIPIWLFVYEHITSEQCNSLRAHLPVAIDYDCFMVVSVMFLLSSFTFTITWCTQELLPQRSQNVWGHGIFTGTFQNFTNCRVIDCSAVLFSTYSRSEVIREKWDLKSGWWGTRHTD